MPLFGGVPPWRLPRAPPGTPPVWSPSPAPGPPRLLATGPRPLNFQRVAAWPSPPGRAPTPHIPSQPGLSAMLYSIHDLWPEMCPVFRKERPDRNFFLALARNTTWLLGGFFAGLRTIYLRLDLAKFFDRGIGCPSHPQRTCKFRDLISFRIEYFKVWA